MSFFLWVIVALVSAWILYHLGRWFFELAINEFVDGAFENQPISMRDNDYLEKRYKRKNLLSEEVLG